MRLTREAFHAAVLARSHGRCVLCGAPAVDAHHVLDRKLFPDGGYYLDNGAAVCARCHWDCETTRVAATTVRAQAGIETVCLPPGFSIEATYDKWGNRLRADGTRAWGPLQHDTGARRALAADGMLGLIWADAP